MMDERSYREIIFTGDSFQKIVVNDHVIIEIRLFWCQCLSPCPLFTFIDHVGFGSHTLVQIIAQHEAFVKT